MNGKRVFTSTELNGIRVYIVYVYCVSGIQLYLFLLLYRLVNAMQAAEF